MSGLTPEQHAQLLKPINPARVGKDGKGFSHVEAYEIRAHLNRVFDFGRWSADLTDLALIFEREKDGKFTVCYRATMRLTVCAPDGTQLATYTEAATGEAKNQPHQGDAHDLAIKTAESQAFKRCAVNLGDNFGLSLYAKGSLAPLVKRTLIAHTETPAEPASTSVDAHITEPLPKEGEPEDDRRETNPSTATVQAPAAPAVNPEIEKWVKQLLVGPDKDENVAPFYARLYTVAAKGKWLNSLVENRNGEMVSASALLNEEQKRAQQERAA